MAFILLAQPDGSTALHYAAWVNHASTIKYLVDNGANIHSVTLKVRTTRSAYAYGGGLVGVALCEHQQMQLPTMYWHILYLHEVSCKLKSVCFVAAAW